MLGKASVERIDERLRIIPHELWQKVKARQALQARELGVRFLWAHARTASPANWAMLVHSQGRPLPEALPRIYNEIAGARKHIMVAGSGSGGTLLEYSTAADGLIEVWSLRSEEQVAPAIEAGPNAAR